ncbi:MAG: alpha/beta hydrolase [Rhodobacteraceae bacterium]|nr:alpha/beta hydrolase [Paracoccaceae bacterium]
MRRIGRWLGAILIAFIVLLAGVWFLAPRPGVDPALHFSANSLGSDLDAYLTSEEHHFSDITPGAEKRIIWAGATGVKTPYAVVYLHGYSATSEEIRPVPDDVAKALGANLFFTRFTGHGRGGAAMAQATAGDWINDTAEALAIGKRLGDKVIVISTSTGGTLAAIAATDPRLAPEMAGIVFLSPNFGINDPLAFLLTWPLVRVWAPLVAGPVHSFTPLNDRQAKFWTTSYPTIAAVPLGALVAYADRQDYATAKTPALFIYTRADKVVRPDRTDAVVARWGGPKQVVNPVMGPKDDPSSHVIAGDILSPDQTAPTVARILDWAKGL